MTIVYFDSSAFVKLLVDEAGSDIAWRRLLGRISGRRRGRWNSPRSPSAPDKGLLAKAAMFEYLGLRVHLCGDVALP